MLPGAKRPPRLLVIAVVLAVLAVANEALDLGRRLRSPWPELHHLWLPLLFLAAYAVVRLLHGLAKVLADLPQGQSFPDIDQAWREAQRALAAADIPLAKTPVFLVLGRPAGSEDALFQAAGVTLSVPGLPAHEEAPLRIYACRQAIYITCAGASLLGGQADCLRPPAGERAGRSADADARSAARLQYLCRLLADDRIPFAPINGVLMLMPLAAGNDAALSTRMARLARLDLDTVRQRLRVSCPLHLVICDLETLPGFAELVAAIPPEQRTRALVCRFPLVPDLAAAEIAELAASGVRWLLQSHLPMRIYPLLRLDEAATVNAGLVRFLGQMHARADRLAGLVAGAARQAEGAAMLGGVFLAGTGADAEHGQAFVAEVFEELARTQSQVAWTGPALADEMRFRRTARAAIAGVALLSMALTAAGIIWLR